MPRLKCIWIPLNSLKDNQKHLIKLWSPITFTVVKLCWLCWLDLQMYGIRNKGKFWPRTFCFLWLGKITGELLEMKAWGTLYPGCILPIVRLCKGQKNPENYRRYYKSSRPPRNAYIFPVFFSCITYQHKGLDRNITVMEICKRTSWKIPNKLLKYKWKDHDKISYR